jgi:hypothetical protein
VTEPQQDKRSKGTHQARVGARFGVDHCLASTLPRCTVARVCEMTFAARADGSSDSISKCTHLRGSRTASYMRVSIL